MYNLYKVVLENLSGEEIIDWEYGETEQEALELVLGRNGTSVRVTQMMPAHDAGLLDAALSRLHK